MHHFTRLDERIQKANATVAIIGLGYVGIPLAMRFCAVGFTVIGLDIDRDRVDALNAGKSPIRHIKNADVAAMASSKFHATTEFARVEEADAVIICVPTPLSKHREPDLSAIEGTMNAISPHLRAGQIISLESTTYPGTTEEVIKPFLAERNLNVGTDAFLVYSPEREDPGNKDFRTQTIPKIVGGSTSSCLELGATLYGKVVEQVVPVSSTRAAELTKLLENIHRAVNIGLVNEMKMVADKMGLDIFEIIDAAATKPFGFTAYYPGPGLGGHCIPVDPFYLTWKAREFGFSTRFIELAGEVNRDMLNWVITKVVEALNARKKAVSGSKILALGISYKRDVDDVRESPSVAVIEELVNRGAIVDYADPHVSEFHVGGTNMRSVDATPEAIAKYDCVVLLTNHSAFDYNLIFEKAALVVDTRGVYRDKSEKVFRA